MVDFSERSDLYIINTCAVTAESERKSAQMIRRAVKMGGRVAVIGCYSQLDPDIGGIDGVSFIGGSKDKTAVFREAEKILGTEKKSLSINSDLNGYGYEEMSIGTEKTAVFSSCRAFIKIQDGCNGRCSYCIIPKTRGTVRSRPLVDIMSEAERLAEMGYKEIVLTGIETSAYDFAPLSALVRMLNGVNGIERLRFGSLSPNNITKDFLDAARESSVFMPHMHLSLQSGSDRILRLMRRPYNKKQMCEKIQNIYDTLPKTFISADIIVGFPTESEEDFAQTMSVVSDYKLSHIHSFPFSPRPGTDAAVMEGRLLVQKVRLRNERLIKHSHEVKQRIFEQKKGTKAVVLIETVENNICTGHTEDFLEIKFNSMSRAVGDIVTVNIISYDNRFLIAEE